MRGIQDNDDIDFRRAYRESLAAPMNYQLCNRTEAIFDTVAGAAWEMQELLIEKQILLVCPECEELYRSDIETCTCQEEKETPTYERPTYHRDAAARLRHHFKDARITRRHVV